MVIFLKEKFYRKIDFLFLLILTKLHFCFSDFESHQVESIIFYYIKFYNVLLKYQANWQQLMRLPFFQIHKSIHFFHWEEETLLHLKSNFNSKELKNSFLKYVFCWLYVIQTLTDGYLLYLSKQPYLLPFYDFCNLSQLP